MKEIEKLEQQFLHYIKKMSSYNEAISLMYWDLRTGAPKKSVEIRSDVIGTLSTEVFQMSVSEEMKHFIEVLSDETARNSLSDVTKLSLEECKKDYEKNSKIPKEEYQQYVILTSQAESIWEEAKEKSDFALFQPYLEKIVQFQKRFVDYWGYEGNKYNTLLGDYEPGMTVDVLDQVFAHLRTELVSLVQSVTNSPHQPDTSFLFQHFPKDAQRQLNVEILRKLQYDFDRGRLDETVHPFAIGLNPNDVRITTKYDEKDFRTAIFGTIHECGHAIYEQNVSSDLIGTPLCDGASMGIHESQSLFFENMIGRNKSFWKGNYSLLQKYAPEQFANIQLDDFYRAINASKPSLIRIEADELTYCLHIILRYEIEKGLMNDEIEVSDLPQIWNEKMDEYLGVKPTNDAEGVLQDVHWAGGSFGYFPSYALGYIYASQFKHQLDKDIPNFAELLETNEMAPIKNWLKENIHQYGKMKKPIEILQDVTGEGLNASYLVNYLRNKYKEIYQF